MSSLNKVMIIGHLGIDPEVRYTQNNTAVATLRVATNERYKDNNGEWQENTEWHRVVAWGRLAEYAQQYIKKGTQVYIEGSIQTRSWEDQQGQKRYMTEIKARTIKILDARTGGETTVDTSMSQERPSAGAASRPVNIAKDNDDEMFDDDLPF
ncbi:MAG TPA: single-stranded DNA-binding protein [Balneolales bacterium]|nr:single-stranded DNA-binding protein [Balneolales bacterium]